MRWMGFVNYLCPALKMKKNHGKLTGLIYPQMRRNEEKYGKV